MAERTIFPEWRDERSHIKAPFADYATVPDGLGAVFVDAAIYLVSNTEQVWLTSITVTDVAATVTVGTRTASATGTINRASLDSHIDLYDSYGRSAGVLVGTEAGMPALFSWKYGTSTYTAAQTTFAAGVVYPVPYNGVLSVNNLSGVVNLVGEHGVRLSMDGPHIQVNITGVRSGEAVQTGLRTISNIPPNKKGEFRFVSSTRLASDSILRIIPGEASLTFSLVDKGS